MLLQELTSSQASSTTEVLSCREQAVRPPALFVTREWRSALNGLLCHSHSGS